MFIRGKPIRLGNKNWVLASSDGYPYRFKTYTGACKTTHSSMPLGPQVVSDLLSIVEDPACHCVYFDMFLYFMLYCEICTKKILEFFELFVKTAPWSVCCDPQKQLIKKTVDFLTTALMTTCP